MSNERTAKGILIASFVWIVILGVIAVAFKVLVYPSLKDDLQEVTSSESQYKHEVRIGLDSFSGYAVFRSKQFKDELKAKGIKLTIVDDQADYSRRAHSLKKERIDLAVFPLDSLITAGVELGEYPASIISVIDETKGADAIVAYKDAVANLNDLNTDRSSFVLTPRSPSEFLSRIVLAHFSLPKITPDDFIEADGAEEVYKRFVDADKRQPTVYALWEPYVSKALEEPGAHILLDSSKLKGYIIDVLVAERTFLSEKPDVAKSIVEAYYRVLYSYQKESKGIVNLVVTDSEQGGGKRIEDKLAQRIAGGIQWKNTLENYAMFGLLPKDKEMGTQHLEDIIINISEVLVKTGALETAPLQGKENTLFYDSLLKQMQVANYHPGKQLSLIKDESFGSLNDVVIRKNKELKPLSDQQWNKLIPVGKMKVKPISFGRGTARLNMNSKRELNKLSLTLNSWDQYYLVVEGHSRAEGDMNANIALAKSRASAAADYLVGQGVSRSRIKVKAAKPERSNGAAQTVRFVVGEQAY